MTVQNTVAVIARVNSGYAIGKSHPVAYDGNGHNADDYRAVEIFPLDNEPKLHMPTGSVQWLEDDGITSSDLYTQVTFRYYNREDIIYCELEVDGDVDLKWTHLQVILPVNDTRSIFYKGKQLNITHNPYRTTAVLPL